MGDEALARAAAPVPAHSQSISPQQYANAQRAIRGQELTGGFMKASAGDDRTLVVISLGHGVEKQARGEDGQKHTVIDRGAVSAGGITESELADRVGRKLFEYLENDDRYHVAFFRMPGEIVDQKELAMSHLEARAHFMEAMKRQLGASRGVLLDLQANSSASPRDHGMEVVVDQIGRGRDGTATNPNSTALAQHLLAEIEGYQGLRNRGVKTYNARTLDAAEKAAPGNDDVAVVIESLFLSNPGDEKVADYTVRRPQELAERIARGVLSYELAREEAEKTLIAQGPDDQAKPSQGTLVADISASGVSSVGPKGG
ncbi:MAG: N-acetylmuramoyl-L-alanine amidase [Rhodospirillales bacterium]|nr:N-acetylmuramoyl-L-alanine amidase [Rhodospirillales bacterium]